MAKHVCIIGAGPSGLVAAKTLLHNAPAGAFKVTMYDAQPRIGGLWPLRSDDDDGLVHPLMVTNQSKHTMHFSDLAWEPEAPQFPRAWMVGRYLERYLKRYPGAEVKLGHRVVGTDLLDDDRWKVTVRSEEKGEETTSVFDHLVVTSGFFGKPIIPDCVFDDTTVPVMHSSKYRDLNRLLPPEGRNGGKILVVGGQMSGVEISGTIASHLSSAVNSPGEGHIANADKYTVHHLIQRPSWVFPLHTSPKPGLAAAPFLPVDLSSYNLNNRPHPLVNTQGHISTEAAATVHGIFAKTLGRDQSELSESIAVKEEDRQNPPYLAMSENYTELVRSGLIAVSRGGKLESLDGTSVITSSGEKIENVAAIILATGFDPSPCVTFLPEKVLHKLNYRAHRDLPLALGFHGTQHHNVPSLGFVGFYRSPYWGVMEMQARFLAALWTPSDLAKQPPGLAAAVADETCEKRVLALRDDPRCSQFPFGDYIFVMQEMAKALDIPLSEPLQPPELMLPHNNLPMNILTPSRYLSPTADDSARAENAEALRQTNNDATAGLTTSRFVARGVFRSLLGSWNLERTLTSRLPSHPSGHFSGTARFLLRDATSDGLQCATGDATTTAGGVINPDNPGQEYLYIEEGQFKADNGLVFQAKRRYVWRYDEARDVISVWFVRTDDEKRADYLFHEVEFQGGSSSSRSSKSNESNESNESSRSESKGWKAKAGHLCIDDFYNVEYEFCFKAVELARWTIGYAVQGPKKDYTIQGVYRR